MIAANNRKPGWFFYPGWIAATVLGILIAWLITWAIVPRVVQVIGGTITLGGQTHVTEDYIGGYILLPALGVASGFLQYLLLRSYLPRMGWWTAATLLGWLLPFLVSALLIAGFRLEGGSIAQAAISVLAFGGLIGLPQWLILRRRIHHASWWFLASVVGWGIALALSGGSISNSVDILTALLLPPAAACVAWWLLLDRGFGARPKAMLRAGAAL
ncbi:MAG: hypothetical protein ACM3JD_03560 [Rudaea sp.]